MPVLIALFLLLCALVIFLYQLGIYRKRKALQEFIPVAAGFAAVYAGNKIQAGGGGTTAPVSRETIGFAILNTLFVDAGVQLKGDLYRLDERRLALFYAIALDLNGASGKAAKARRRLKAHDRRIFDQFLDTVRREVQNTERRSNADAMEVASEPRSYIDLAAELEEQNIALLEWLKVHGPDPDLWHMLVCNTDPDGRDEVYRWIAEQAECDAGTAAQIFQFSNGQEAYDYPVEMLVDAASMRHYPYLQTAKIVADRWHAGGYKKHCFAPLDVSLCPEAIFANPPASGHPAPFRVHSDMFNVDKRQRPVTNYWFSDFQATP